MECPNCDRTLTSPTEGHADGCMLAAFMSVIHDREEHEDFDEIRLEPIDINAFWDRIGPAIDATELELGLDEPAETITIKRVGT